MTAGIAMLIWGEVGRFLPQLRVTVPGYRTSGFPFRIYLHAPSPRDFIDCRTEFGDEIVHPVTLPVTDEAHQFLRKLHFARQSPFDRTLCVDVDAWVQDGTLPLPPHFSPCDRTLSQTVSFAYVFRKLEAYAFAAAYDGVCLAEEHDRYTGEVVCPGWRTLLPKYLPEPGYFSLINGGVLGYNRRHPDFAPVLDEAIRIMDAEGRAYQEHEIHDQVCLSLAFERLQPKVLYLDHRIWNARHPEDVRPGTKILHHRASLEHYIKEGRCL